MSDFDHRCYLCDNGYAVISIKNPDTNKNPISLDLCGRCYMIYRLGFEAGMIAERNRWMHPFTVDFQTNKYHTEIVPLKKEEEE